MPRGPVRLAIHTVVAAVVLIVAAVWRFDIPPMEMLLLLFACILGLAVLAALGALAGWLVQKLRGSGRR